MLGAAAGVEVTICLPGNASPERRALLEVYGAEVVVTDRLEGTEGAAARARELARAEPGALLLRRPVQQSGQPAGASGDHRPRDLGPDRRPDHPLRRGDGHHGNHDGDRRVPEGAEPGDPLVGVQPDSPFHGLEGLKHLATTSQPPALYDPGGARRRRRDSDRDWPTGPRAGWPGARGILVGWSAGAARGRGARHRAAASPTRSVVVIGCDTGARYLSEPHRWRARDVSGCPDALRTRSAATASAAYPAECCGALVGRVRRARRKEVVRLAPAVNRRTDDPHRYLIAPDDLRRLEPEVRAGGLGDRRVLPLAPRPPGGAVGLRRRPRLAVVQLSDRADRPRARRRGGQLDAGPTTGRSCMPEPLDVLSEV